MTAVEGAASRGSEARIIPALLTEAERAALASEPFGDMFKLVADLGTGRVAAGGEFHADAEELLLDAGGQQSDLWGANYYPARPEGQRLEYTALINIRPAQGNRGHQIEAEATRNAVRAIVERLIGPA